MVAVMVVESVAWLLGEKDVVAELADEPETVVAEVGDTVAVKPENGAVVTLKLIGTPGWLVLSVAVTVSGALPATYVDEVVVTVAMLVPAASVYTCHVGPG